MKKIICNHCEEKECTITCQECGSLWCEDCVSPGECLACGASIN